MALAELLFRVPRAARVLGQEVVVVGAALGCVLLSHPTGFPWSETAAIVACLTLPLRLRWPWLAMVICLWALTGELGLAPALVGLYRTGRTAPSPLTAAGWALAAVVASETTVFALNPMPLRDGTLSVFFVVLWMLCPTGLGLLVTTRQRLGASLVELRLAREAELEARADRARAQERARIGQEIHDAVGHHATLIAVEAAALSETTAEPETKETAQRVRKLATASLAEMRAALGLSNGTPDSGNGLPDLADLADLVTRARGAGMTVAFDSPALKGIKVSPAVGRATFRIVQESLTNAAKHAPGATVRVVVLTEPTTLLVTVQSGPATHPVAADVDSGGQGLAGMAERATTAGGRLDVERGAGGVFTVRARLPLEGHTPSKVDAEAPTIDGSDKALEVR
jgi:signal transduction histidine kinase